jgi:hypothetical protein
MSQYQYNPPSDYQTGSGIDEAMAMWSVDGMYRWEDYATDIVSSQMPEFNEDSFLTVPEVAPHAAYYSHSASVEPTESFLEPYYATPSSETLTGGSCFSTPFAWTEESMQDAYSGSCYNTSSSWIDTLSLPPPYAEYVAPSHDALTTVYLSESGNPYLKSALISTVDSSTDQTMQAYLIGDYANIRPDWPIEEAAKLKAAKAAPKRSKPLAPGRVQKSQPKPKPKPTAPKKAKAGKVSKPKPKNVQSLAEAATAPALPDARFAAPQPRPGEFQKPATPKAQEPTFLDNLFSSVGLTTSLLNDTRPPPSADAYSRAQHHLQDHALAIRLHSLPRLD